MLSKIQKNNKFNISTEARRNNVHIIPRKKKENIKYTYKEKECETPTHT